MLARRCNVLRSEKACKRQIPGVQRGIVAYTEALNEASTSHESASVPPNL